MTFFSATLVSWQREHGRHELPWQGGGAYCVWLSEIMLQQTQVTTVIPYYLRFIAAFPALADLAVASEEEVLTHWSGLGYYARGRNLHKAARIIYTQYGGIFPQSFDQVLALPGIGRSTAAAICAQAFHQPHAILDGNVKRVLARYCGIEGHPAEKKVENRLWQQAEALLPGSDVAVYTQALMDFGALLCTRSRPQCASCPVQTRCVAFQTGRVEQLPTARKLGVKPERHASFVLAVVSGEVLLQKRASSGIWGGLWCLPELGDDGLADYLQSCEVESRTCLPSFTHTFTHFKLHITPMLLHFADKPSPGMWIGVNEALNLALPTPVRRMLASSAEFIVGS